MAGVKNSDMSDQPWVSSEDCFTFPFSGQAWKYREKRMEFPKDKKKNIHFFYSIQQTSLENIGKKNEIP